MKLIFFTIFLFSVNLQKILYIYPSKEILNSSIEFSDIESAKPSFTKGQNQIYFNESKYSLRKRVEISNFTIKMM